MPRSADAQKAIGQKNRLGILRFIRDHGETTRFDITSALKLSHTTVKTYIDSLLDEGLIEAAGTAPSIGGRKPVILRLIPNSRFSLGINFAPGRIDLLLINLKRDVIFQNEVTYERSRHFGDVLSILADEIDRLVHFHKIDRGNILGMGMTFPGLVDDSRNMLVYLANLGVKDFSLDPFKERVGLDLFAENEAQAAANAERILGNARGKDNLVYISIAEGIGAGIVIDGRIYRSGGKNAGEFGHVRISDEPLRCNCGRTGCWELFASSSALLNDYVRQSGLAKPSLEMLFAEYRQGEPLAVTVLEKYTRNLFKGIDIILLAYSPDDVIIGGDLAHYADDIIELGINQLELTQDFQGYEKTRILGSALLDNAALMGAALLPMDRDAFTGGLSADFSSI